MPHNGRAKRSTRAVNRSKHEVRLVCRHHLFIYHAVFNGSHIRLFRLLSNCFHARQIDVQKCARVAPRDLVDLRYDALGVGTDYLRAVAEVDFVAVVVRGVVRSRYYYARRSLQMADSKRKLRRGARAVEDGNLAARLVPDACCKFAKMFREVADIVGNHEAGGCL